MNPAWLLLVAPLWVIGKIAASVFQQQIDEGVFRFATRGLRGALSGLFYWMGTEYIEIDEWVAGAVCLGLGTLFILWALLGRFPRRYSKRLSCTFCGKHENEVGRLVAGPGILICDDCRDRVHTVLTAPCKTVSTPIGTIQYVGDEDREARCTLCRKRRYKVQSMAAVGSTRICGRCLKGCDYIAERLAERTEATHGPRAGKA
jgi:hypothetical protein